ncbi:MAG: polysaccharide deacetylase, partial [Ketobacteraceae bacterium]|nr:polysaccharide deacetylase [Ketobacteraceae bacterium]
MLRIKTCSLFITFMLCLAISPLSQAAVILQYHHVSDETPPITSISPALFKAHLKYIKDNGFSVWPLTKLVSALQAGEEIPDKVVSIT